MPREHRLVARRHLRVGQRYPPFVVAASRPVGHDRLATDRASWPCSPPATGAKLTSSVASRPTVGTKPQWWHTLVMSMSLTAGRGPGRPPAAKADETRKRILHAARQVFSERGYDGATFQEIAVRADLTRPAINHYFANKRVLYQEVVEQTHELVIVAGIERARREPTLMGRLAVVVDFAMEADAQYPASTAFLATTVLESQRHPELSRTENDAVRATREFLVWAVNDAIERGELAADVDVSSLAETLLVVLCGVGFYIGFVGSYQRMATITDSFQQLLAGTLWRPPT